MNTMRSFTRSKPSFSYSGDLYSERGRVSGGATQRIGLTGKSVVHVEAVESDVLQMQAPIDEYPAITKLCDQFKFGARKIEEVGANFKNTSRVITGCGLRGVRANVSIFSCNVLEPLRCCPSNSAQFVSVKSETCVSAS
jgi:hypothetical protein